MVCLLDIADEDTVSDSSTDSLLWSEDELGQDVDVTTNPDDDGPNEGRREFEIVRCICEVQEENDFMIQVKNESTLRDFSRSHHLFFLSALYLYPYMLCNT